MVVNVRKNWEAKTVDCPSASVPILVAKLRGGESITIKALASDGEYIYIGDDNTVTATNCYLMDSGDTLTLKFDISFGPNSFIEVWALPSNAGDDVCYVKLIDKDPSSSGG